MVVQPMPGVKFSPTDNTFFTEGSNRTHGTVNVFMVPEQALKVPFFNAGVR
jgi:hypothetical protein